MFRRVDLIAAKKATTIKQEQESVSFHKTLIEAQSIPQVVWHSTKDEGETYYHGIKFGETEASYLVESCEVPIVLGS